MSDIVTALGPGRNLDSLTSFAPDYVTVRRAFNDLLVFPHLEAIEIEDTSKFNLLSLVMNGNSRFSELSNIDIGLSRKVINYDATFSELVGALNIHLLVMTLQPAAQEFADHARAESEVNLKFFADLTDYVASVDARIGSLDAALAQLDAQIQSQSDALANKNIVTTLWEVLKTLYKLVSNAEDSDVQIAAILGITITTVAGSFKSLFNDQLRLQKIISSLKGLRTRTQDLKTRFVALSAGLKTVSIGSKSLLDVWDDVSARMGTVAEDTNSVPAPQAEQLKKAWAKVASDAKDYIDTLQRPGFDLPRASAAESHRVETAKFNAIPKVPITAAEIRLHKLAAVYGHDALSAPRPPSRSGIKPAASDEEVIRRVIGPPDETKLRLESLADTTGQVIDQFNTLLQQPYLDQYKCTSPIDGSDSNLYTVMNLYRNEYLLLQQETLPIARDLHSYAGVQAMLLPYVVPDAEAKATDLPMSLFIATNAPLVAEYNIAATDLSDRSTKVKQDWDNVVNLLQKLIAECEQNITNLNNTLTYEINELTEQQKNKTLYATFLAAGAFIAFTAAAFLTGGALAPFAIGGVLGILAVWQAVAAAKLTPAINELKAQITNAENTKAHLDSLLPYANNVTASLSEVSLIWAEIVLVFSNLVSFYNLLSLPHGALLLIIGRDKAILDWMAVQVGVDQYIKAVSK